MIASHSSDLTNDVCKSIFRSGVGVYSIMKCDIHNRDSNVVRDTCHVMADRTDSVC